MANSTSFHFEIGASISMFPEERSPEVVNELVDCNDTLPLQTFWKVCVVSILASYQLRGKHISLQLSRVQQ